MAGARARLLPHHGPEGGGGESAGTPRGFTLRLDSDVEAAAKAREALERLEHELEDRVLQDMHLLVSELVTNSVRHAHAAPGEPVHLKVSITGDRVFVAVEDGGSGFLPAPRTEDSPRDSGWGLHLVDQVSSRWGVNGEGCTRVWLELERPSARRRR